MSIKNKFESIKQEVEQKKESEEIVESKDSVKDLALQKASLVNRIKALKTVYEKLQQGFFSASRDLIKFKQTKTELNSLLEEYREYLKEKDINSISDLLNNEEFVKENEVVDYKAVSPAQDPEGKRGRLAQDVEEISQAKKSAKEMLPDMELDFRGGKNNDEDSPRKKSLNNIKQVILGLEQDLEALNKDEQELKSHNLPKIKKLLAAKIDDVFANPMFEDERTLKYYGGLNLNYLSDEVLSLSGNEFWPEIKQEAEALISKKYSEKFPNISLHHEDIDNSLENEKLVFDVCELRESHPELLQKNKDLKTLTSLENRMKADLFYVNTDKVIVRDGKIYPESIVSQVEYFQEKNIIAKQVCQEIIEKAKNKINELKSNIGSAFMAGKNTKHDIEAFNKEIERSQKELADFELSDNFYSSDRYTFFNKTMSAIASPVNINSDKDWAKQLNKDLDDNRAGVRDLLNDLISAEGDKHNKLLNDIYNISSRWNKEKMDGFEVPYSASSSFIKDANNVEGYSFFNQERINNFLSTLDGASFDKKLLSAEFDKLRAELKEEISSYPNSEEIINNFNSLQAKYQKIANSREHEALEKKNFYRYTYPKRMGTPNIIGSYRFEQEFFYGRQLS